jgi:hypothetical protein
VVFHSSLLKRFFPSCSLLREDQKQPDAAQSNHEQPAQSMEGNVRSIRTPDTPHANRTVRAPRRIWSN